MTSIIKANLNRLFSITLLLFFYSSFAQAGGGVQLGFSNTYVFGGMYSLSGVDGVDIRNTAEEGYVHSRLGAHYDLKNETAILDLQGEVGRFLGEEKRVGIAVGMRPMGGRTKDLSLKAGELNFDKEFSALDLLIGVNLNFLSWVAKDIRVKTDIFYYRSPEVLSLGDFKGLNVFGVIVALPVIASSELYISYDNFSGSLDDSKGGKNVDIMNTFSMGIRLGL